MKEEEINLLAKEERYEQAIMILVDDDSMEAAESFCNIYQTEEKRLMTTLLKIYI